MIGHVNSVHGCWRFQCDVCGEGFLSKDDMIVLVSFYMSSSHVFLHVFFLFKTFVTLVPFVL
jgi:hypothetical protein